MTLGQRVDLPVLTALWVLGIHVVTIVSPVVVVWAVASHRPEVDAVVDRPALLYLYAALLAAASVSESAQNAKDRWYLTGVPPSPLDLVFGSLVALALAVSVLAVWGDLLWLWPVVLLVWAGFPLAYVRGWPVAPVQAVLGVGSAAAIFAATGEPVVFLTLPTVALTLYFLDLLVRTRQQVFHGFTTGVNIASVVAVAAAFAWTGTDEGWDWAATLTVGGIALVAAAAARPVLVRAPATPRHLPDGQVRRRGARSTTDSAGSVSTPR